MTYRRNGKQIFAGVEHVADAVDEEQAELLLRYLNGLRDNVGGDHVLFDRLAALETGQGSNWGYQSDEADITSGNARFTAVKNFIAAL